MIEPLSVWVTSLGCPKNRVDTENLLGSLGPQINFVSSPGRANLIFINTCAFIEPAVRESLRVIFDVAKKIRKSKRKPALVVAGCLPGRYGRETLAAQIPEVDLWLESANIAQWPEILRKFLGEDVAAPQGRLYVNKSYAWLKIAEGCQQKCSFCVIPSIRGPLQSLPFEAILGEARQLLAESGVKELVLVAQDLTAWGRDLITTGAGGGPRDLPELITELAGLEQLRWLRLMYLYPASVSSRLLEAMAEGLPILPYLDLPFQHSETSILSAMGRPFHVNPRETISRIRNKLPNAALRATLMVGFPGETEQDFKALCAFVEEAQFQNLGVFTFLPEEGTPAAAMPGQVPERIREERRRVIMELQAGISASLLSGHVGERMEVLVDEERNEDWPGLHKGRVWFQAPEVDGSTWISGPGVECGKLIQAEIVDSQTYDLSALA